MPCDVLVMESTFGHARYVFPPKEETLAAIRRFVDDALADGVTPVLLGYALGKAQEILKFLSDAGYPCRAHLVVHAVNRIYEADGVSLPNVRPLGPEGAERGEVVVRAAAPRAQPGDAGRGPAAPRSSPAGRRRRAGSAAWTRRSRSPTTPTTRRSSLREGDRRLARVHGARPRRRARRRAPHRGRAGRAAARAEAARAALATCSRRLSGPSRRARALSAVGSIVARKRPPRASRSLKRAERRHRGARPRRPAAARARGRSRRCCRRGGRRPRAGAPPPRRGRRGSRPCRRRRTRGRTGPRPRRRGAARARGRRGPDAAATPARRTRSAATSACARVELERVEHAASSDPAQQADAAVAAERADLDVRRGARRARAPRGGARRSAHLDRRRARPRRSARGSPAAPRPPARRPTPPTRRAGVALAETLSPGGSHIASHPPRARSAPAGAPSAWAMGTGSAARSGERSAAGTARSSPAGGCCRKATC